MPSLLITGVSSGIGRATAIRFAQAGWQVTGTVRDVAGKASPARAHLPLPSTIRLRALDLGSPDSVSDLAGSFLDEDGVPDVLLNNAGVLLFGSVEDTTLETDRRVFQVNLFGPLQLIKAFLPAMRERGSGTIANVTSLGGRLVFPFFATYNASKHAMEGYSEGLWHELKPFGIRVKVIEPGYVATPIWEKADVTIGGADLGSSPYRPYLQAMAAFESTIERRSTAEQAAEEVWRAINDDSDRLRYPIAAYAKSMLAAQRVLGSERVAGFMHNRWMGGARRPESDDR